MKRIIVSVSTVAAAAFLLIGAGRDGGGRDGGGRDGGGGTVYHRYRVSVPHPSAPAHTVQGEAHVAYPQRYGSGERIAKPAATIPPAHHADVVRNPAVTHGIERQQAAETQQNHYYWHTSNGVRYSHYYDGHNHWYGFYHGPAFYWTRYNAGRWWWYDTHVGRWVYWWDGFWWWPGPGGAAYVYVDNNYYPYEGEGVTVQNPVVQEQAPPAAPASAAAGKTVAGPDGKRTVQIFGDDSQAFLYDNSTQPPTFMKYLGQGVAQVRFTGGKAGEPAQILVEFKDDSFALFDTNGNSQSAAVLSTEAKTAPPSDVPDSIPPPPTSAPGQ
jgi:hypothetical protein